MSLRFTVSLCILLALPTCGFIISTPICARRGAFSAGTTTRSIDSISSHLRPIERSGGTATADASRVRRARTPRMAVGDGTVWDAVVEFFEGLQKGSMGPSAASLEAAAKAEAEAKLAAEIAAREAEEMAFDGIWVMMNGLPGKMGFDVAAACLRKGFRIVPYALTGPDVKDKEAIVGNQIDGEKDTPVSLLPVGANDADIERAVSEMKRRCCGGRIVAVDYTHPTAVNGNAEFYAKHGLNFVMGTTGGDREALMSVTRDSGIYAVIAPNMGKQIVALQTAIELMAKEFPSSFGGYKLEVTESHQSSKADTSGTAKALAADLATLTGESFDVEAIKKVREREAQLEFGVPEEHLGGHAFHTYSLKSSDGTVEFQFRHNVCGRTMYAEGTADAVEFLAKQAAAGAEKRVYNMVDVLKEGGI